MELDEQRKYEAQQVDVDHASRARQRAEVADVCAGKPARRRLSDLRNVPHRRAAALARLSRLLLYRSYAI